MRHASPDPLAVAQFEEDTNYNESGNGLNGSLNESEMSQSLEDDHMDAGSDSNNAAAGHGTCEEDST